jgi:fatty acid desaturase
MHEMETERIRSGEITIADKREVLQAIWRKTRRQGLKDYVAFPLLAGPFAPWVFAGNMSANLIRNVWSYMIIFCGHFPDGTQEFSVEETQNESRGMWYFRQVLGSANLTGGKLFHLLSGNLSHQIEHHLFPDVPAHRYAEIAPQVRDICKRYGIPYHAGPLPKQFGTVVRKIVRLSLPAKRRSVKHEQSTDPQRVAA